MADYSLRQSDFQAVIADSGNDRIVRRDLRKSLFPQVIQDDMRYISKIGTNGTGDDQFNIPSGIAVYKTHIIVVDTNNNRIVKRLLSDLSYVNKIGSSGTGDNNFSSPVGICISPDGKYIYVCDTYNDRIHKRLFSDLSFIDEVGSYGTGNDNFDKPAGICVSPDGLYLYITDRYNHRVVKRSAIDLTYVSEIGSFGNSGDDKFNYPFGIGVTPDGNYLIVADRSNHRIVKRLISDLSFVAEIGSLGYAGDDEFYYPTGLQISKNGKYFIVIDQGNARIIKREIEDLSFVAKFGSTGTGDNNFYLPYDCAFSDDDLYVVVADGLNNRIKKHYAYYNYLFQDIVYESKAGTTGAGDSNLNNPTGIAISQDKQHIVIADNTNNRLIKYSFDDLSYEAKVTLTNAYDVVSSPDNLYVYAIDNTAATAKIRKYNLSDLSLAATSAGSYNAPKGITITPDGNWLFISDSGNDKIYKVATSTLVNDSSIGTTGAGDDQFSNPCGLAATDTYFFVADTGNNRVHKRLVSDLSYVSEIATAGGTAFNAPADVSITPDEMEILVVDAGNHRMVKLKFESFVFISEIGSTGSGNDQFSSPLACAIGSYGITRVETIAEPTTDYFYDKLVKYLPDFIDVNEIMTALLRGFENPLLLAKKNINASTADALKNYRYQGSALLQYAIERGIFLSGNESDIDIQYLIENHETIQQERGTLNGLKADLLRMVKDKNVSIEEVDTEQCGWWGDVSYPCIDEDGNYDPDATASWGGCSDQVNITTIDNNKKYSVEKLRAIINKYLVPGHVIVNLKTEPDLIWFVAVNDNTDEMDLSKY